MMDPLIFLLFHILLYGISPLLVLTIFRTFKSTSFFYSYFGFLYVFTQLFAILYSIKISENLIITGGNIAYSSIILITFFIGIASQDPTVIRNLISIQVIFNFILFFLYQLLVVVLNDPTTINIFGVSSGLFNTTITINIVSSFVFIVEVIIMFYSLEKIKEHIKPLFIIISLYVLVYIAILILDGFLFPFTVSLFLPEFGQFIAGDVQGKLILGIFFAPFLLVFMILHKKSLALFIEKSFSIRLLIFPKRKKLIEKLRKVEKNLKKTEKRYEEAYNRATFYKDLFTHDISSIIQNISMSFSLLESNRKNQEKINSKKSEDYINIISSQLSRGKSLISNIRKLAEIDKDEVGLKSTNLLEYLSNAINFVKESIPQKHIEIKVETVEKQIITKTNELLADIFENILVNAVKYNHHTVPEISIKISKAKLNEVNYVRLEFMDNGIGVQDFKKEKIFLEGYKELKGEKGMGIGLSLITKIIKLYKGKIWVEDRVEGDHSKGSNFIVLIPEA
ncbi:MAG: Signal transduction histidine kinase [Candidatus Lokiarchaeum sp. GC14_75]|nr:MAG: Signal transduction histidine kinase [Candidatus Lokiarchaeum sp. GC14_75]